MRKTCEKKHARKNHAKKKHVKKTYEKKHVCSLSETMSSAWETTRRVGVGPGLVMWSRLAGPGFPRGPRNTAGAARAKDFHIYICYCYIRILLTKTNSMICNMSYKYKHKRACCRGRRARWVGQRRRVVGGCRRLPEAWGIHTDMFRKKERETEHVKSRPVILNAWNLKEIAGAGDA